jgi:uncharacterized protein (TIGR03905 family)
MKQFHYGTQKTCSSGIDVWVDGGVIDKVEFQGGCQGNLRSIDSLLRGMSVDEAISRLEGIQCGSRGTSCGDQLAKALKANKD